MRLCSPWQRSWNGCRFVVRGEKEEEIRRKAAEHAKETGICEVTPELIEGIKANILDANPFSPGNPG